MDLDLIEKFTHELIAPEGKQAVQTAFTVMRKPAIEAIYPLSFMVGKFGEQLRDPSTEVQVRGCAAYLAGLVVALASERKELREFMLENFIEHQQKCRGANVIDFFSQRKK